MGAVLDGLAGGLAVALQPGAIALCLLGVTIGTFVGLFPGLSSASGVALLFPVAVSFDPAHALIMLAGIYYGAQYGGTITSVLLRMPGEPSSIVTMFDGYPLAQKGKAGTVLAVAGIASFIAGTICTLALSFLAVPLAEVAFLVGPPEMLVLISFAMVLLAGLDEGSLVKGLAMAALGFLVASVGLAPHTGEARFTLGRIDLYGGFGIIEVLIGVFAIGEVLRQAGKRLHAPVDCPPWREMFISRGEVRATVPPALRGTAVGFGLGLLPGAGPTMASYASYSWEKGRSADPRRFGQGAIEGVAGPEAANNAAATGSMVPTLTLGIPGSGTAAILLSAFLVVGVQPGPLLIETDPDVFWGLIASFYVGNLLLLALNLPLAPLFASILRVPYRFLYPIVLTTALVGAYAVENRVWGMALALAFGVVGFLAMRLDYPLPPFVLGLILGPRFEAELARTLAMGRGSLTVLLERPGSLALIVSGVLAAVLFAVRARRRRRQQLDITASSLRRATRTTKG